VRFKQWVGVIMNSVQDVRWEQRFQNYERALAALSRGLQQREYNELERQGLIQAFEYCYELAWKTLQDIITERGFVDIAGPRPVLQKSFELGLISDGHAWMQMVKSRNATAHTYDEQKALEIIAIVRSQYHQLFVDLDKRLRREVKA
jgi:nucleotidyltransferase substrate binding protein (TIGR01987 family)